MAGAVGVLQEVLTVVQRLSDLEKRHDREFKELKDRLGSVRSEARDLDRRLLILETRFDGHNTFRRRWNDAGHLARLMRIARVEYPHTGIMPGGEQNLFRSGTSRADSRAGYAARICLLWRRNSLLSGTATSRS